MSELRQQASPRSARSVHMTVRVVFMAAYILLAERRVKLKEAAALVTSRLELPLTRPGTRR